MKLIFDKDYRSNHKHLIPIIYDHLRKKGQVNIQPGNSTGWLGNIVDEVINMYHFYIFQYKSNEEKSAKQQILIINDQNNEFKFLDTQKEKEDIFKKILDNIEK